MKTAFAAAEAIGAEVKEFGPTAIAEVADGTKGIYEADLRRTPSGQLAPASKTAQRAAINTVSLRLQVMEEWLRTAYTRYKVNVPKVEAE